MEKFVLIFFLNADSSIRNRNSQFLLQFFNNNCNMAINVSKFYSVGNYIQKNLLKSFNVGFYDVVIETNEKLGYFYLFQDNFILLNVHYFSDCFLDSELTEVFGEVFLVFVQNCIVQNVMDKIVYELGS